MKWFPVRERNAPYANAAQFVRLECEPDGRAWRVFGVDANGERIELDTPSIEALFEPHEQITPALPGYGVIVAYPRPDGRIEVEHAEVAAWRIVYGVALPVCPALMWEGSHAALVGPHGIYELPTDLSDAHCHRVENIGAWMATLIRPAALPKPEAA